MKRIALLTVLCLLLCTAAVQADGMELQVETPGYGMVQIRGTSAANVNVTLMLVPAGTTYADCMAQPERVLYLRQVRSDGSGQFLFTVRLPIEEDVEVQAFMNSAGGERDESLTFTIKAAGEEPPEASPVKVEGARVTINGTAPSGYADKRVAIAIVAGGLTFAEAQKADIAAISQVMTQAGGVFEKTVLLMPGLYQSGFYNVLIREEGQDLLSYPIELFDANILADALIAVNAASTPEEMANALKGASGPFGHDEILESSLLDTVCAELVAGRPYAQFEDVVDNAVGFYNIQLREYQLMLELNAASSARRWADVERIVTETYTDLIVPDLDKLNDIDDKKAFFLHMCDTVYDTVEDIREAFDDAYTAVKAEQDREEEGNKGHGGSGSYSGGGGGGGGGGTVIAPIKTDQPPISALPELDETKLPVSAFTDLDGVQWAQESIEYFRLNGVLRGNGDGTFRPNEAITREEFVKFLVGAFALEPVEGAEPFADEQPGAWYGPYLAAARQAGIVLGREDNTFGIGEPITRADLAVMAYRAAETLGRLPQPTQPAVVFTDFVDIPDYALNMITALQQAGIINGYGDNRFHPLGSATRAESAKIVYGLIKGGGVSK